MAIAKATCTCNTCGKKFEYRAEKFNRREAESFEAWAAENITECWECRKAREAKEAEEARVAKAWPTLTGSEKQVAWATKIRDELVSKLLEVYKPREEDAEIFNNAIKGWLGTRTDSRFWIDNRYNSVRETAKDLNAYLKANNADDAQGDGRNE